MAAKTRRLFASSPLNSRAIGGRRERRECRSPRGTVVSPGSRGRRPGRRLRVLSRSLPRPAAMSRRCVRVSFGRYPLQRRPDTRAMAPRLLVPPRKEISIAERFREIGIQKRGNAPAFLLPRRKCFSSCKKKIFFSREENFSKKFFYTGKLNPETWIHFLSEKFLLI